MRSMLGEWAYGAIYGTSAERSAALGGWLWRYNHLRPQVAELAALTQVIVLTHRATLADLAKPRRVAP